MTLSPLRAFLATLTLGVLSRAANAQAPRAVSPDFAAFDRYVAAAAKTWHVPALAIAVVKNDSLVFAKGYGVLEVGKPQPADAHTRFAIGSTTKAMTSAALAMLVDEGKIRWDGHVIDYLSEFRLFDPYVTRELTIRGSFVRTTEFRRAVDLLGTLDLSPLITRRFQLNSLKL